MSAGVESNITEVMARISKRAGQIQSQYEATVTNHVKYAAAVDQGYTRIVVWADLSPGQRFAILKAMEKRYGPAPKKGEEGADRSYKREGTEVSRSGPPKSFKIVMPPAGMLVKSVKPVKAFGRSLISRLPSGFTDRHLKHLIAELGFFAQSILVDNTPVDQAVLIKGWEVKLG